MFLYSKYLPQDRPKIIFRSAYKDKGWVNNLSVVISLSFMEIRCFAFPISWS